jgi:hypothetical protein
LTWTTTTTPPPTTTPRSSQRAGVSTKHASAVALEAFTEAALAARRHPAAVCPQGLALSALRDDPVDGLGCSPPTGPGRGGRGAAAGWRYRRLTPACSTTPSRTTPAGWWCSAGCAGGSAGRWCPARPRHALAAGEAGTARPVRSSPERPASPPSSRPPSGCCGGTHDPRRPGSVGGRQGHLPLQCSGGRWAPARSRSPSYWCGCTSSGPWTFQQRYSPCSEGLSHD